MFYYIKVLLKSFIVLISNNNLNGVPFFCLFKLIHFVIDNSKMLIWYNISYCNEKKFVYHLGKNRTTVQVNFLINIKEMGKRQNHYLTFVLLSAVFIFQSEKCNGQFHWGKNHRLEAQKLKTMLSRMRPNNVMMTTNMVRE